MKQSVKIEFLKQYEKIHNGFSIYCSNACYGAYDKEDLIQDCILQTLIKFESIKCKDRLLYYMIGVANNLIKNRLRRKKFSGQVTQEAFAQLESTYPSAEEAMDVHYLYEAMNKLMPKQKEAIILFEICGYKMKEIAEMQDSSVSATKTRISRGRDQLKKLLLESSDQIHLSHTFFILLTLATKK